MNLHNYQWDPSSQWDEGSRKFMSPGGQESDTGLIASGGFAEVFKAKDINFDDRYVALKIYREALVKDTGGNSRQSHYSLEKEFKMAEELSHPNIVSYKSLNYITSNDHLGRTSRYPVVVMEYATDGTLSSYLHHNNPTYAVLDNIIADIILGLSYLHQNGIIHRDLKPGNILITKNRQGKILSKITDFGISKDSLVSSHSTTGGIGTPHYMAPEQHDKKKFGLQGEISPRTDFWSIGIIVYKIFTGKVTFGAGIDDIGLVREAICYDSFDLEGIPARYKNIVTKCLTKEAENRPASAEDLLSLFEGKISEEKTMMNHRHNRAEQDDITRESNSIDFEKTRVGKTDRPQTTSSPAKGKKNKVFKKVVWGLLITIVIFSAGKSINDVLSSMSAKKYFEDGMQNHLKWENKMAFTNFEKAVERDHPEANIMLGRAYQNGEAVRKDYKKAKEYFDQAISLGDIKANFYLAFLYLNGQGVAKDTALADDLFSKSVSAVSKEALKGRFFWMTNYGLMNYNGFGMTEDKAQAVLWYKKSASLGYSRAQYTLGYMYGSGQGVLKDDKKALKWYRLAADQGNANAQAKLGEMYDSGQGVAEDNQEAVKWYRLAADQGNANAQKNLGVMYASGLGVPEDDKEAVKWYRLAADQGNADAQANLGYKYDFGQGVAEDNQEAVKWYRLAADQGNANAQTNLGAKYATGEGVPKDNIEAVKWYRLAAEQGYASAQVNLGFKYAYGQGVPEDDQEAVKWYRMAAEQGNADGQFYLGIMNDSGQGVKEDNVEAVKWYRMAADQDHTAGQRNLGTLYYLGEGVLRNYNLALKYWRLAANKNDATSLHFLGIAYEDGKGVPKNHTTARTYYRKAEEQGYDKKKTETALNRVKNTPSKSVPSKNTSTAISKKSEKSSEGKLAISSSKTTTIYLKKGEKISLTASGSISFGAFAGSGGPNGINGFEIFNLARQYRHGCLLASFGSGGSWLFVGTKATLTADVSGYLKLYVNDNDTSNNSGSFIVQYQKL